MQLFKSLFCLQGFDNRNRFLLICSIVFITFIVLAALLTQFTVISVFILIGLLSVFSFTALRRLNDAQLNRSWLIGPCSTFLITGLIIIFIQHPSTYWLLLLPIIFSALLLTYPSKSVQKYILGYSGPVDLSEFEQNNFGHQRYNQRIEPTLLSNQNTPVDVPVEDLSFNQSKTDGVSQNFQDSSFTHDQSKPSEQDIGEIIRLKLLSNKNALITIVVTISLVLIAILVSIVVSSVNNHESEIEQQMPEVAIKASRLHPITLPDNFSLMLTEHQGLIINWVAESTSSEEIWSLTSGQGDQSCKEVIFNNGEKVRTLTVFPENGTEFFAQFSPLDTKNLLQAIAFRGSFSLCGYNFSLKGSQAVLGKNSPYADMIEY